MTIATPTRVQGRSDIHHIRERGLRGMRVGRMGEADHRNALVIGAYTRAGHRAAVTEAGKWSFPFFPAKMLLDGW